MEVNKVTVTEADIVSCAKKLAFEGSIKDELLPLAGMYDDGMHWEERAATYEGAFDRKVLKTRELAEKVVKMRKFLSDAIRIRPNQFPKELVEFVYSNVDYQNPDLFEEQVKAELS